jgi:DNA-binding IclR family transcriptional regulator
MAPNDVAEDAKGAALKVASLERALSVLKVFETADNPISLAEISQGTELYKSTILRFLLSFEAYGYIRRTEDGLYVLGPGAFRLGLKYRSQFRLDAVLTAVLKKLVDQGTESASFHVRDGDQRVCVARVDSHHPTLDRVSIGDMRPLIGAAGKIIRAFDDETIDPDLESVRHNGIALSYGEIDPACWALAAPVVAIGGKLLGAISLSGPKERFTPEAIAAMSVNLQRAVRELSDQAIADSSFSAAGSLRAAPRT